MEPRPGSTSECERITHTAKRVMKQRTGLRFVSLFHTSLDVAVVLLRGSELPRLCRRRSQFWTKSVQSATKQLLSNASARLRLRKSRQNPLPHSQNRKSKSKSTFPLVSLSCGPFCFCYLASLLTLFALFSDLSTVFSIFRAFCTDQDSVCSLK